MTEKQDSDWLALAGTLRVRPDEVRLVFDRYAAQAQFALARQQQPLPISQWFSFYHMEKKSDGQQAAGPAPSGCSVDSDAVNDACISRPEEFLQVLKAYAESRELAA